MEMTPEQNGVYGARQIRRLNIELRDPFGQPIHKTTAAPKIAGQGGAYQLPAMLDALDITDEVRVPFIFPGSDERAPFYFVLQLDPRFRVNRAGLLVMG